MLGVMNRSRVDVPSMTKPERMTIRLPKRSRARPTKGWKIPFRSMPTVAAMETVEKDQPNSSCMGGMKAPKPWREPMVDHGQEEAGGDQHPAVEEGAALFGGQGLRRGLRGGLLGVLEFED